MLDTAEKERKRDAVENREKRESRADIVRTREIVHIAARVGRCCETVSRMAQ